MNDEDNHMALEAYSAMQQECGSQHPNLIRLAAAHRVISAVADQALKEAYVLECRMRLQLAVGLLK